MVCSVGMDMTGDGRRLLFFFSPGQRWMMEYGLPTRPRGRQYRIGCYRPVIWPWCVVDPPSTAEIPTR